jgi:trimethylamine:corrinoid methyltransferase-like protein
MSFATLLTQEQVERVHDASLEILENVGLMVRFKPAREIFEKHGCKVDSEKNIVRFPRPVVEKYRVLMPPTFTFYGRDRFLRILRSSLRAVQRLISLIRLRGARDGPSRGILL